MASSRARNRLRLLSFAGAIGTAFMHLQLCTAQQVRAAAVAASPSPESPRTATILPVAPMMMPGCPNGDVLSSLNPREFPGRSWRSMTLEQQATHPINLVFMNLAGVPSNTKQSSYLPCLDSWGVKKSSVKRIKKDYRVLNSPAMSTEVLVMRTSRDVFVVFRATDDDWIADFTCLYTDDVRDSFNAPKGLFSKKMQLHKGFWTAYKAVDSQLMTEIKAQWLMLKTTNPFSTPSVWIIGHSLGGALGAIAALKLTLDPLFLGNIGGVVTYGMPRVGNEAWQSLYDDKLMDVTVRFQNFRDMFASLPGKTQVCPAVGGKVFYSFRHVGRAVQLCPDESTGMEVFNYYPKGTEGECKETVGQRPSIATHLLGHYFDGWRRAYAHKNGIPAGILLSTSLQVRSVMCSQCAIAVKPYPLPTNKAARNDGVLTCVNDKSCADKFVFGLVSWSGLRLTSIYRPDATCDAASLTCQVPIPGLQTVTNAINSMAPNITLADLATAAGSLWHNGTAGILDQLQEFIAGASSDNSTYIDNNDNTSVSHYDAEDYQQVSISSAAVHKVYNHTQVSSKVAGSSTAKSVPASITKPVATANTDPKAANAHAPGTSGTLKAPVSISSSAHTSNSSSKPARRLR